MHTPSAFDERLAVYPGVTLSTAQFASTTDNNDYWSKHNGNFFESASSSAWSLPTEINTGMNSIGSIGSTGWRQASMQANALASYSSSTQILFTHSLYNNSLRNATEGTSLPTGIDTTSMNSIGSIGSTGRRQASMHANAPASYSSSTRILCYNNSLRNATQGTESKHLAVEFFKTAQAEAKSAPSAPMDNELYGGSSKCDSDVDVPTGQHATVAATLPSQDRSSLLEVKPRPRRRKFGKGGKHSLGGRPSHIDGGQAVPIQLTASLLRQHFAMPLHDAARKLGICATAVKKVCRKMGIMQWPFQRLKPIQCRLAKLRLFHHNRTQSVGAQGALEMALEIKQLEAQENILLQGLDNTAL